MDRQTLLGGRLDPGPTKEPVVRVSAKEGLPVMAALNEVPRLARNDEAGETRHVACYRGTGGKKPSTDIVSDPFLLPAYRFYALYDKTYREDLLSHAWRLVRTNGGSPGIDGVSFEAIERGEGVEGFLRELARDLSV